MGRTAVSGAATAIEATALTTATVERRVAGSTYRGWGRQIIGVTSIVRQGRWEAVGSTRPIIGGRSGGRSGGRIIIARIIVARIMIIRECRLFCRAIP